MVEGSTGTGVVISKDLQLSTAFLGDSPVVIFVRDPKTGDITAQQLTRDHHPGLADEKARIEEEGGYVDGENRLLGISRDLETIHSLAVSRAFGDDAMRGLSREPEFATADLKKEIAAGREVYILVSSDGLYDGSRPQDYVPPLQDAIATGKEAGLAEIRRGSSRFPKKPKVYFEEWDEPMISGIRWVSELIEIAGGEDVFADLSHSQSAAGRVIADGGRVIEKAPDVILGSWCGKKFRPERVAARAGWDRIPAVRDHQLHEIRSADILQPGPAALTDGVGRINDILRAWARVAR